MSIRKNNSIRKNISTRKHIFRSKICFLVDLFFVIELFFLIDFLHEAAHNLLHIYKVLMDTYKYSDGNGHFSKYGLGVFSILT